VCVCVTCVFRKAKSREPSPEAVLSHEAVDRLDQFTSDTAPSRDVPATDLVPDDEVRLQLPEPPNLDDFVPPDTALPVDGAPQLTSDTLVENDSVEASEADSVVVTFFFLLFGLFFLCGMHN